jgi:hypothetical protein
MARTERCKLLKKENDRLKNLIFACDEDDTKQLWRTGSQHAYAAMVLTLVRAAADERLCAAATSNY